MKTAASRKAASFESRILWSVVVQRDPQRADDRVAIINVLQTGAFGTHIQLHALGGPVSEFADRETAGAVGEAFLYPGWESIGGLVTESTAADMLATSTTYVRARIIDGDLFAVTTRSGDTYLPAAQFDSSGGVLDGLHDVVEQFRATPTVDEWTLASWMASEDSELGSSPWHALSDHNVDAVVTAAKRASARLRH